MSTSPVAGWIRAWVRLYTAGLPAEVRAARRDEIDDDLWCHLGDAADNGRSGRGVDGELLTRWVLGIPADVGWSLDQRARSATAARIERSPSMMDRTLGGWAVAASLIYLALLALYIPGGYQLWEGGVGVFTVFATLLGAIGFVVAGIGLAWNYQDDIGRFGAIGGALVALGSLFTMGGTVAVLPIGSIILMWELQRIGVVARRDAAIHVVVAVAFLAGSAVISLVSVDPAGRARGVALFAVYLLSWIAIGVSLIRHSSQPEVAAAG
jgi:hypothetical protein